MLGGLHIEMVTLKLIGDLLEDTGWTNILYTTEVAEQGTSNSFIKGEPVSKSRRAHQITASVLYVLMKKDYEKDGTNESFHAWRKQKESLYPQFMF